MTNESSGDELDVTVRELAGGQKVFGRYTLRKVLGRGGMGVVWLARDEELERDVALKFLPDLVVLDKALLDDLKRETRRSLELTHKNIVRIHDFVQSENSACISMEYIDGDTLSNLRAEKEQKVFEPNELAAWTAQLCDALDYAHNHARIIHRDLKPANLMVNQRGDLKVSDFGIARSLGDSLSKLTMVSGTSGTLVYMSPQQLDGERGSHLDDIYSLGATLYDLLTSKPPFYSGNIDKQVHERIAPSMTERRREFNLEPALVPPAWEQAVAACLAKDPAQRPQSATEVARRLQLAVPETHTQTPRVTRRRKPIFLAAGLAAACVLAICGWYVTKSKPRVQPPVAASSTPAAPALAIAEKGIAVLPFESLSAEKDDAFFADGIQDDVLTSLNKIKGLTVIARGSVMTYRGENAAGKLREIGQALRVAHVLQGSVRRAGNRVVISVALVDTRDDHQLWSERYERTMSDALSLQGELAVEIARELRATLTPEEGNAIARKPTENPEAYVLYLRARELEMQVFTKVDPAAAAALYQQAIDLDPKFALAHARLSARIIDVNDSAQMQKALAEAEEALRLQPGLGEARFALAKYYLRGPGDLERALAELDRAEDLIPNSSEVWNLRGQIYKRQNKIRERIAALQHAEILDPRNGNNVLLLMMTYCSIRDWPAATQAAERLNALAPESSRAPWIPAFYEFRRRGEIPPSLREAIAENPVGNPARDLGVISLVRYEVAMLERDYAAAARYLAETTSEHAVGGAQSKLMHEGLLAVARGADAAEAEHALVVAREALEKRLAAENEETSTDLGLIDAFRGRKEDALRHARRAIEMPNNSSLEKNDALAALALIYARTGEPDEAIKLIEHLLTVPANLFGLSICNMTLADLKWRWVWDPLRSDPRFQRIIAGPEPKTIY